MTLSQLPGDPGKKKLAPQEKNKHIKDAKKDK